MDITVPLDYEADDGVTLVTLPVEIKWSAGATGHIMSRAGIIEIRVGEDLIAFDGKYTTLEAFAKAFDRARKAGYK